jgi:holo-[acyl-carrier protein] synthase
VRIVGFGSDLCKIDRIEAALARHGERFTKRIFTEREIARAEARPLTRAGTYAKRFAAKEACSKALGTGFSRGVFFRDMGVSNLPSGAPTLALSGGAAARLEALLRPGERAEVHLTLTDDHPFALAVVLIVAVADAAA